MRSKQMNVARDFRILANKEKRRLAKITNINEQFFTYPIITKVLTKRLEGKRVKIKLRKRRLIIE